MDLVLPAISLAVTFLGPEKAIQLAAADPSTSSAAAVAMAGQFQIQQPGLTMDFGRGSIGLAGATGVAIYTALMTGGYKPGLVGASLGAMVNLAVGVHVSTTGRRHRTVAFVNFCACFVPLIVAMAHGGEFNPVLVKKIYDALP